MSEITLKVNYLPPYDWQHMLGFLQAHIAAPVEKVDVDKLTYAATLKIHHKNNPALTSAGWFHVQAVPESNHIILTISDELSAVKQQVLASVRALFDLDANPETIAESLSKHSLIRQSLVKHPGLRLPGSVDHFGMCVRAIAGQFVSVKSATTICKRIAQQYGAVAPNNPYGLTRLFPDAFALASQPMVDVGLTKVRSNAIMQLAQTVVNGTLHLDELNTEPQVLAALTALPGIGPWTAEYIAMRAFKFSDAFPAGDLILRRAVLLTDNNDISIACLDADKIPTVNVKRGGQSQTVKQLTEKQCRIATESLAPWRAYAAMHFWTHYLEAN